MRTFFAKKINNLAVTAGLIHQEHCAILSKGLAAIMAKIKRSGKPQQGDKVNIEDNGKKDGNEEREEPTDEALRAHIRRLIPLVNLQTTGVKAFTKLLSKECGGVNLKPRMKFIKIALSEAINELDDESASSSDDEKAKTPRKTGLSVKKEISKDLAKFLGRDPTELVARTDVVKGMWDYIKAKELQNPENKREIILDDKMKKVFGCDSFTMFTMNKYIGAHIHPFKPVDLTTNSTTPKKKKNSDAKRKKRRRNDNGSDSDDDGGKKRRKSKKPGLQPPYKLSADLTDLVGTNILPRPQVVKGIWDYIKKHNLQNPEDKREIICDDKLKKVMGGEDKVSDDLETHDKVHRTLYLLESCYGNFGEHIFCTRMKGLRPFSQLIKSQFLFLNTLCRATRSPCLH